MEVKELVFIIGQVCGLGESWAKVCIYYCMATHCLKEIKWMPVLVIQSEFGSGKSQLISVLKCLCFKPTDVVCHETMTAVSLRNMLNKAEDATAIIEEGDLYPRRRELESYLINRVDKDRTASIPVTHQVIAKDGSTRYITEPITIPGATILHDRHGFTNLAAQRRAIVVEIVHKPGEKFLDTKEQPSSWWAVINRPQFKMGTIPEIFDCPPCRGSALDAWSPLIRIADDLKDEDWLCWAWEEVLNMNEALADGRQWELERRVFGAVIRGYTDAKGNLVVNKSLPLKTVTRILKEDDPNIHEKAVAGVLRKFHMDVHNKGGSFLIFAKNVSELKRVGTEIGYKDDLL